MYLWPNYPKLDSECKFVTWFLVLSFLYFVDVLYPVLFCFILLPLFVYLPVSVSFSLSGPQPNTKWRDPTKLDMMVVIESKTELEQSFLSKSDILYSEAFYKLKNIHHSKKVLITISPNQSSCIKNQKSDGNPWLYGEFAVVEMHLCRNSH